MKWNFKAPLSPFILLKTPDAQLYKAYVDHDIQSLAALGSGTSKIQVLMKVPEALLLQMLNYMKLLTL